MRFIDILNHISKTAEGPKYLRFLNSPLRYLKGTLYTRLIYPVNKKALLVSCQTFFDKKMHLLLPAGLDIYLLGAKTHDSEIRLSKFLCKTLKTGDNFIDVGAHFGFYSLLASVLVGNEGTVISIEASSEIFRLLSANTESYPNINCSNLACTNTNSSIEFYEFPLLYSEYNTLHVDQYVGSAWFKSNPPKKISIPGRSLDSILEEHFISPNFIKIDVEGAENDVLQGMINILRTNPNLIIAMEYLSKHRGNQSHNLAANTLIKHGFFSHIIDPAGILQAISIKKITAYLESRQLDSDNLIFIHASNTFEKSRESKS
jgi:FkbM family methyltransferase